MTHYSPGSPEWRKLITASKIPTILGLNPYETPGELWMRMSGLAEWPELTGDHLEWGHYAEDSLVKWWLHKNPGWQAGKEEVAYTDDTLPFPNQVTLDRRARRGRKFHIIECKTSNSTNLWADEELPSHVAVQVLAQMGISGIHEASVVRQLGSTVPKIYEVEWDAALWAEIVETVAGFYDSLGESEPPMPPADVLAALAPDTGNNAVKEINPDDAGELITLLGRKRDVEAAIEAETTLLTTRYGADKLKLNGKLLITTGVRRFSKERLPEDVKHLILDDRFYTETTTRRFDEKAFQAAYPEIHQLGLPSVTHKIGPTYV